MRSAVGFVLVATVVVGCSSSTSQQSGDAGSGGNGGLQTSNGGSAGSVISDAGTANGGASGGGGTAAGGVAGEGGIGGLPASGGQGGSEVGGSSGSGGIGGIGGDGAGGAGGASAVVPSQGCGMGGRPNGGEVVVDNDHIYDFPATYDGTTPFPLVIALHGANNPNTILQTLSNGSRLETNFVRAFPKSTGSAWSFSNGTGPDSMRISAIYNELLANYCIDTNRVFLMGHSSGAQMTVHMVCVPGGDPRFKAIAPVAASKYCDTLTPVPVMYIQGMMDAQRNGGNGADVVALFTSSNMCTATNTPYAPVQGCNSTFDGQPVDPGCIEYQGCSEPTIWCSHNDNGYNLTDGHEHGWPCFASNAIADFFMSLP